MGDLVCVCEGAGAISCAVCEFAKDHNPAKCYRGPWSINGLHGNRDSTPNDGLIAQLVVLDDPLAFGEKVPDLGPLSFPGLKDPDE